MNRLLATLATYIMAFALFATVKPGIETLRDNQFKQLEGKRVGLITNPTGVDNNLVSTIDILHNAKNVKLVALFAPEHGVRGNVYAGKKVSATTDAATGVKVYSLYGNTSKPTKAMLSGIDVLIYDIQDNGCRSYTFISTMGAAMEACAENGVEFMVLDRPNPLGGYKVEGPVVEKGRSSIVGRFAIPYLYGLTPGELAKMLNSEKLLRGGVKCKLSVVPMTGWNRNMTFAETGMPWVLPSPHIPTPESAMFYPATGIIGEFDFASIGVGYTLPFQLIAAPWINGEKFAQSMNALNIPGVRFRPICYKPFYSKFKGEDVEGVQIFITDLNKAPLTLIQFYAVQVLAELYPTHKLFGGATENRLSMFDKVVGNSTVRTKFGKRYIVNDMLDYWNKDAEIFKEKSSKYYLY